MARLRPLLVALLMLVAATVAVQTAVASARPPGRGEHVSLNRTGYTPAQRQETLDYWTPERIAAARPMPLLGTSAPMPTATRSARAKDWVPQRPAYIVPPTRPLTPVDQLPPFAATDGAEAPWQPLQAPARTTGKLFARFDLGDVAMDAHCTAEVVNSEAKNMVMSAAHCLYYDLTDDGQDNPVRATNLMFLAGYRDGQFITDRWTVGATVLFSNWMATGDPDFDLAILLMNDLPSWSGEIANVLDAQGIGFNLDQTTLGQVTAPGYSIAPFNPERLSYCSGNVTVMDDRASALPCRLTEGASGTPWLTQFDARPGSAS